MNASDFAQRIIARLDGSDLPPQLPGILVNGVYWPVEDIPRGAGQIYHDVCQESDAREIIFAYKVETERYHGGYIPALRLIGMFDFYAEIPLAIGWPTANGFDAACTYGPSVEAIEDMLEGARIDPRHVRAGRRVDVVVILYPEGGAIEDISKRSARHGKVLYVSSPNIVFDGEPVRVTEGE